MGVLDVAWWCARPLSTKGVSPGEAGSLSPALSPRAGPEAGCLAPAGGIARANYYATRICDRGQAGDHGQVARLAHPRLTT